jgi:glycosyltransferase involved in cell wall biosynthesis
MLERVHKNVFYFSHINAIGGVEQFLYYLSKTFNDFVVYYKDDSSDLAQLKRLSERVEVHKWRGEKIKCDKIFLNYNLDIIDSVEAKEYVWMIHMNYKSQDRKPVIHPKITKFCAVSKIACQEFEDLSGKKCELLYNLVALDKPKKVLKLISATRLTSEKGRAEMVKLGEILDNFGIPYLWLVFTNDWNVIKNPNIIYMSPRLDITGYIAEADYLVQLSSSEAFCFSVVESLMLGVPVIVRDLPIWKEIGLKDRENCFILDFDMKNVTVNEIYKGLGSFKYTPPKSDWDKYLDNDGSYDPNKEVEVTPLCDFWDIESLVWREKDKSFNCSERRKNRLLDLGYIYE